MHGVRRDRSLGLLLLRVLIVGLPIALPDMHDGQVLLCVVAFRKQVSRRRAAEAVARVSEAVARAHDDPLGALFADALLCGLPIVVPEHWPAEARVNLYNVTEPLRRSGVALSPEEEAALALILAGVPR